MGYPKGKPDLVEVPCRRALQPIPGADGGRSLNPYVSGIRRGARQDGAVGIKANLVSLLQEEVKAHHLRTSTVWIGTSIEPYNSAEQSLQLVRQALALLCRHEIPVQLLTSSPLVTRDADLLAASGAVVNILLPTLGTGLLAWSEPAGATAAERLSTVTLLAETGVCVRVGIAPLIPGATDLASSIERVAAAARSAGASEIWTSYARMRTGVRIPGQALLARPHGPSLPGSTPAAPAAAHHLAPKRRKLPQETVSPAEQLFLL